LIKHYALEQGALEIQYIEEFFGEFRRRKTAAEIVTRLRDRDHIILMAEAPLPDDPGLLVPVSYKVGHEIRLDEADPKLADLVARLGESIEFEGRRVLYSWIGGTRVDRRAGSLGDRRRLRRGHRQDQEQVLRHARYARPSRVRGDEV
jgi:hypothetical protein